tara:strand:+ start:286 stop:549 length:264 start_codon:yes stop_codon:yes gene_type:complete
MSLLTVIAGIPLFTTIQEALDWAASNGLSGYHVHNWQGQQGYMGGANHLQATGLPLNSNAPVTTPPQPTPPPITPSSGGSSSGGGGY